MKKTIYVSHLLSDSMLYKLKDDFENIVLVNDNQGLPKPVASHPDLQILKLCNTIITTKELADSFSDVLIVEKTLGDKYPGDVLLNACLVGDKLFANVDFIDASVKIACIDNGIEIVHVNQGYANCSTLSIKDKAIISADNSIIKAAKKSGLDTLQINSGSIILDGYDYGFIGGASFYCSDNDTVYFFGDISTHPDGEEIIKFIENYNTKVVSLDTCALFDFGSAVII